MMRWSVNRSVGVVAGWCAGVAGLFAVVFVGGCSGGDRVGASSPVMDQRVVIDGDLSEWSSEVGMWADSDYLYFRIQLPEPASLQSNSETVVLAVDLDDDPSTGIELEPLVVDDAGAGSMGMDLQVLFSPAVIEGGVRAIGSGVRVNAITGSRANPIPEQLSATDIGLVYSPTHVSSVFEARISRHTPGAPSLEGVQSSALRASSRIIVRGPDGSLRGASEVIGMDLPARSPVLVGSDASIPSRSAGEIRVVSYNVLFESPESNPWAFSRTLTALDPDIVLVQEWAGRGASGVDADDVESWFNAYVPSDTSWSVIAGDSWGTAVVTKHPAYRLHGEVNLADRPVRVVTAMVETPIGEVSATSLHLECCGGPDGPEEMVRLEEAQLINDALVRGLGARSDAIRVVGGDFNLVGTRRPLDVIRAGLGTDGRDLAVTRPLVLGDPVVTTWWVDGSEFAPSRLDYVLVGPGNARVVRSFVLETRALSASACERAGLELQDTAASDHLPVVVDISR